MIRRLVLGCALWTVATVPSSVGAQPAPSGNPWEPAPAQPPPQPQPAPSQPSPQPPSQPAPAPQPASRLDSILLKDHTKIEGHVKEQVRGQYVVIDVANGPTRTISWDQIAEVTVWSGAPASPAPVPAAPGAAPAPAPAPAVTGSTALTGKALDLGKKKNGKLVQRVSTTTAMNVNKEGASLSRTVTCKSGNDQTCKETEALTIGSGGPKATYSSEVDCSKTPGSDLCKETKELGVSAAGFGASMTKEQVVAVDEKHRPSQSINFSITANVGGGFGSLDGVDVGIFFSSFDAALKIIAGGQFPKKAGGNWAGFAIEPDAGFVLEAVTISGTTINGFSVPGSTSEATGFRVGGTVGVELVHFNQLNEKTLKQRGIGVLLGLFLGYQETAETNNGMTTSNGDFTYGPELDLVFPNFNPGTAKYSSSSLNFMVLPTGDVIFITLGYSTSF
jgi:hypothetical protein